MPDRVGRDGRHDGRIAVRSGLRHELDPQVAAGARAVVDDDLLAPRLGELLADRAREQIRGADGREGHDDRIAFAG
jgi:hypothetical protein